MKSVGRCHNKIIVNACGIGVGGELFAIGLVQLRIVTIS